ncbi:Clathrin light chain [Orchesella cincta]|uniref:Clathrin light chain n=1 Tax=Orchesella cincta TaxID=48709 RepID=A0A1D2NAD0_ORCCI|nr:Clathrin light chain [Orchesella cincta]
MDLDGFDDAFGTNENGSGPPPTNGNGVEESDPAADFLAREQSNLAGLEDDVLSSSPVANIITNGNGLLDRSASPDLVIPSGDDDNLRPRSPSPTVFSQSVFSEPREEPEKIRIWREEQKMRLEEKDREEELKREELREAAKKELEDWYKSHEEQLISNRKANRNAEKELVAETEPIEPGSEWERIAKLCDFNPKGSKHSKDISRMRSIILQLKQTPPIKRQQ